MLYENARLSFESPLSSNLNPESTHTATDMTVFVPLLSIVTTTLIRISGLLSSSSATLRIYFSCSSWCFLRKGKRQFHCGSQGIDWHRTVLISSKSSSLARRISNLAGKGDVVDGSRDCISTSKEVLMFWWGGSAGNAIDTRERVQNQEVGLGGVGDETECWRRPHVIYPKSHASN